MKIVTIMVCARNRNSCSSQLMRLEVLPLSYEHIFFVIKFMVNDKDNLQ
jgi:hypothetical protein